MKEKTEQNTPFVTKIAESPWVKGPVLGAGVMALLTPLLKWTNHVYKGEKMPRGNYFPVLGRMLYRQSLGMPPPLLLKPC